MRPSRRYWAAACLLALAAVTGCTPQARSVAGGRTALTLYANDFGPDHCGDGHAELTPVRFPGGLLRATLPTAFRSEAAALGVPGTARQGWDSPAGVARAVGCSSGQAKTIMGRSLRGGWSVPWRVSVR
jgi:hypothetical protein